MTASIVIGATLASGFLGATRTAERRAAQLGETWKETNTKLGATAGVIKYGKLLKELKAKQDALGGSSRRLERGIQEVTRHYRAAKSEAKSWASRSEASRANTNISRWNCGRRRWRRNRAGDRLRRLGEHGLRAPGGAGSSPHGR